ncbi:uncharacterized protein M421DRAFT_141995 [Didymella exigua CBS 183.55]|uniref:Secreted protein n=1 Tax=Didymella exigua CBS 183.55 TaxID=1150837 RepID=A0A6A5RM72_9PLEO|nr:uncharacterized protein M421DRAFT_141995 [Didymella exigua CBS 183.55]KAF1928882.1 hypothetical protein M421DRAFT_141995 [Didymella exigua CBS 183.55]
MGGLWRLFIWVAWRRRVQARSSNLIPHIPYRLLLQPPLCRRNSMFPRSARLPSRQSIVEGGVIRPNVFLINGR